MKTIEFLEKLCSENLDLGQCYVYEGYLFQDGAYILYFPLIRDAVLDLWFKKDLTYFCVYNEIDSDYSFLPEPDLRAKSNPTNDCVIDFWILEK